MEIKIPPPLKVEVAALQNLVEVAAQEGKLEYAHFALLHVSLMLRVMGDLAVWWPGRRWGGLLNAVALLLFLANTGRAIRGGPATR